MRIELKNLSFSYKKKTALILDDISLTLSSGKLYVLLGKNGSGKTTLGKIILGLLQPNKGEVLIDGADAEKISAGSRACRIGYLFQNPDLQLFAPTVWEELTFPFELTKSLTEKKKTELYALLDEFHLTDAEDRFPLTMSGGEKQRLALATVMSRNVEFLILDEPTSSIDKEGRDFIINFTNGFVQRGGGALIITHDEDYLSALKSPEILRLRGGNISEN